MRREREVTT